MRRACCPPPAWDAAVVFGDAFINFPQSTGALKTIKGIGPVLGLTIMLETGDIHRFPEVGDYSSYSRGVRTDEEAITDRP